MKKLTTLCITLALTSVLGCGQATKSSIYDDPDKIASESNSFSYYEDVDQDIEDTSCTVSVHGMDGMDTIWTIDAADDTEVSIDFELGLQSGEVKLVLISPDGELDNLIECREENYVIGDKNITLKPGKNRIKIVSKDKAEFDLNLSIDDGDFEKLGL
jgi:hypothetical protein